MVTILINHSQTAVLKETLRLAFGIVSGLPRVVGPNATQIAGVLIPAGVSNRIQSCFP
jgi:cytochrome P450